PCFFPPSKDSEIKKAGSDGDIVDSSADSPPSLKARTHSVSTDVALRSAAEPSPAWKALGRQLNAELPGPSWEQQHHGGEPAAGTPLPASPRSGTEGTPRTTSGDSWPCGVPRGQPDFLMPGRRAVSVHEEQLREPQCLAELGSKWGPAAHTLSTQTCPTWALLRCRTPSLSARAVPTPVARW
uniref:Uncharacterized protein n=1 Tax=Anas zonorhyncha TaxID=75864 RepID=A0A8B9ZV97_9AVES